MSKLKKVRSIRVLSLSLYRDEVGKRYYRWRDSDIRRMPRWVPGKRFTRWIMVVIVLVIAGSIAYPPLMRYASDKVIEKVADQLFTTEEIDGLTQDPSIQQIIKQLELGQSGVVIPNGDETALTPNHGGEVAAGTGKDADGGSNSGADSVVRSGMGVEEMSFSTNEEALKFISKKFELSELKLLADKAKGGLTKEEKSEIKLVITERLTPTEYDSLKILAVMEIQRRQGNLLLEP